MLNYQPKYCINVGFFEIDQNLIFLMILLFCLTFKKQKIKIKIKKTICNQWELYHLAFRSALDEQLEDNKTK